jgi:hypothetical protein
LYEVILLVCESTRTEKKTKLVISRRDETSTSAHLNTRPADIVDEIPIKLGQEELTWHNIFTDDVNVVVPVRTRVLMPEANGVPELVDDDTEFIAIFSDGDCLGTGAFLPNE